MLGDPTRGPLPPWSALGGLLLWLVLFVRPLMGDGDMGMVARLLLFAILVLVPLALGLVRPDDGSMAAALHRIAVGVQPVAAAFAVVSFLLPAGLTAALLALPWLGLTGIVALLGLVRLLSRGLQPREELCVDAGLIYLALGGGWLLLSRYGATPMGFGDLVVQLTAVHFHYAGFLSPLLAGLAGRSIAKPRTVAHPLFAILSGGILVGPALVAAGITLSPMLEIVAVFLLAASLAALSLFVLVAVVPALSSRAAQALLVVSAASLATAMGLAAAYGVGEFTSVSVVGISRMVQVHGWLNAMGFGLCGLLAWRLEFTRRASRG